jgi:hypothetical protein
MPHSLARLSASASSHRNLSTAVFITNIAESDFSVHTGHLASEFVTRLRDLGWIEGSNVTIEYR